MNGDYPCAGLLGTIIDKFQYTNDYYSSLLLSEQFLQKTYSEASAYLKAHGDVLIQGIPVGIGFNEGQYNMWQNLIQKNRYLQTVTKQKTEIKQSVANKDALKTWLDCIRLHGGLYLNLDMKSDSTIFMEIEWNAFKTNQNLDPKVEHLLIKGATYQSGIIDEGLTLKRGDNKTVILYREKLSDEITIVINLSDAAGSVYAFIPKIIQLPEPPPGFRTFKWVVTGTGQSGVGQVNFDDEAQFGDGFDAGGGRLFGKVKVYKDGRIQAFYKDNAGPMTSGPTTFDLPSKATFNDLYCEVTPLDVDKFKDYL